MMLMRKNCCPGLSGVTLAEGLIWGQRPNPGGTQPSVSEAEAEAWQAVEERGVGAGASVKSAPAPENWSETGPRAWSWGWWAGQGAGSWICRAGHCQVSGGKSCERAEAGRADLVTSLGPGVMSRGARGARPPRGYRGWPPPTPNHCQCPPGGETLVCGAAPVSSAPQSSGSRGGRRCWVRRWGRTGRGWWSPLEVSSCQIWSVGIQNHSQYWRLLRLLSSK